MADETTNISTYAIVKPGTDIANITDCWCSPASPPLREASNGTDNTSKDGKIHGLLFGNRRRRPVTEYPRPVLANRQRPLLFAAAGDLLLVMGERELPAALLGLFAGCVWDLHAAKSAGFNALFFMLLCFGVSAVMERYIRSTFVTHMLFALPAPFLYGLLYWLCFILIKGVDDGTNTLFTFYLPCALYTAVVAPILWFLLRPLRQRLNRKALQ